MQIKGLFLEIYQYFVLKIAMRLNFLLKVAEYNSKQHFD